MTPAGAARTVDAGPGLRLVAVDAGAAAAVVAGDRSGRRWAPDFPGPDDVVVASMAVAAAEAAGEERPAASVAEPFEGPWHIEADGEVVGTCGFKGGPREGEAEIGYDLVPSARGRGLATRAVAALIALAAGRADTEQVVAETAVGNAASQAVLARLGFTLSGRSWTEADGPLLVWRLRQG